MRRPDPRSRSPAEVPEQDARVHVRAGMDTDGDGVPDTVITEGEGYLLLHTDLDGDGWADQVLGIGPDATVRFLQWPPAPAGPEETPLDDADTATPGP